jgi:nucleotide-binding universal stress UspA family protein
MTTFRRILVNINPSAGAHPALDQAEELARRMHAALAMVDVLPDVPDRARRFCDGRDRTGTGGSSMGTLRAVAAQRDGANDVMLLRGRRASR